MHLPEDWAKRDCKCHHCELGRIREKVPQALIAGMLDLMLDDRERRHLWGCVQRAIWPANGSGNKNEP